MSRRFLGDIRGPAITLLGGAPAIGKTHAARLVAQRMGIPCVSTDAIRAQLRRELARERFPDLFLLDESAIGNPVDYLRRTPLHMILSDVRRECLDVWKGVESRIRCQIDPVLEVIEGIAIIPGKASLLVNERSDVKVVILVNSDLGRIRKIINERGLGGPPHLFSSRIRRKQIDWVEMANDQYRAEAERLRMPIVDLSARHCIGEILEIVS